MSYDGDFYRAYEAYLDEPVVRRQHNYMLAMLAGYNWDDVLDLGCGQSQEIMRKYHTRPGNYIGVDLNVESTAPRDRNYELVKANYRDAASLAPILQRAKYFTAWTSLFSTEITAPYEANYALYQRIFRNTNIQVGVVAGFYYASKKTQNPIGETGGISSYQTLERLEDVQNDVFEEVRTTIHVPSAMFGQDVYEVWKLFIRK